MRVHGHGTKDKLHIDTHIFLTCAEYIKGILLESMCCGEPRTGHVQSKTKEKMHGHETEQRTGCMYNETRSKNRVQLHRRQLGIFRAKCSNTPTAKGSADFT